jgi:hypothetical protein
MDGSTLAAPLKKQQAICHTVVLLVVAGPKL